MLLILHGKLLIVVLVIDLRRLTHIALTWVLSVVVIVEPRLTLVWKITSELLVLRWNHVVPCLEQVCASRCFTESSLFHKLLRK